MSAPASLSVERFVSEPEELARWFEGLGSLCFCQYHDFPGDHRAFQARLFHAPEENRADLCSSLRDGKAQLMVARDQSGQIIGSLRFEAPDRLPKIYEGRLYRGLPVLAQDRSETLTVACLLVHPDFRRRQVATRLVEGLIPHAKQLGVRKIQAFPRGATDVSDEENWLGPEALFVSLGFTQIHDFAPYPIYELAL